MLAPTLPSGPRDFDFLHGDWSVAHRRLKDRLTGCSDWDLFAGFMHCQPVLAGQGNVDDNLLNLPEGAYHAVTLRSFDARDGQWSIWWLDGRTPSGLDVPMRGRFSGGQGEFLADDTLRGQPITVRFRWTIGSADKPVCEQAFSPDGGATWETNWVMTFSRADADVVARALAG